MRLSKTISIAAKKTGMTARVANHTYRFMYKGYQVQFMSNGRAEDDLDAICFYTTKTRRTEDDMNSDHWPGTFHNNLSQCFKHIDRMTS